MRFELKEEFLYTYAEVVKGAYFDSVDYVIPFENFSLMALLRKLKLFTIPAMSVEYTNTYDLTFLEQISDNPITWQFQKNAITLMNKLYLRYKDHYCFSSKVLYENLVDADFEKLCKPFMIKVFNVLDYTFIRYNTLLELYEDEKEHLLDKLESSRSGSRSLAHNQANSNTQNSKSLYNDTPQTTDVLADIDTNQHVSELNKGQVSDSGEVHSTGSDEFEETESHDTMTIMAKLDEIEKQFSNVWKKWLNEFDGVFIEEVNY